MPDESGDIIIVANPEVTTSGNYTSLADPSGPGGDGPNRQIRENNSAAAKSVSIDSDASDDDIVVIGQSLRGINQSLNMQLTPSRTINLPCIGAKSSNEIRSLSLALRFRVTTKNYGVGRAGENYASSLQPITVEINKEALKGYSQLSGGLIYLSLHEIAHSFKEMRDFNKRQFEAYSQGAGAGLSLDDRKAQYPNSPEFKENEARANSIARAIAASLNGTTFGFTPTNGYSAQC